jgi:hypothetical protein
LFSYPSHFTAIKSQISSARSSSKRQKRKADTQQVPDEADAASSVLNDLVASSSSQSASADKQSEEKISTGVVLGINAVTRALSAGIVSQISKFLVH